MGGVAGPASVCDHIKVSILHGVRPVMFSLGVPAVFVYFKASNLMICLIFMRALQGSVGYTDLSWEGLSKKNTQITTDML